MILYRKILLKGILRMSEAMWALAGTGLGILATLMIQTIERRGESRGEE